MKFLDLYEDEHPDKYFDALDKFSFRQSIIEYYLNFKKEIYNKKEFLLFISIVFTIAGVFLNINSTDVYLKNIQVLLLIISLLLLFSLTAYMISKIIKKTTSNFVRALDIIVISIIWCFLYNSSLYIYTNYNENLNLLFKYYLTFPILFFLSNFLFILLFKLFRKKFKFQSNVFVSAWGFFNVLLIQRSFGHDPNMFKIVHSFFQINILNVLLYLDFGLAFFYELFLIRKSNNASIVFNLIRKISFSVLLIAFILSIINKYFPNEIYFFWIVFKTTYLKI